MRRLIRVYPRVGGGNFGLDFAAADVKGLSPRGRGKPSSPPPLLVGIGSIPAWAGETSIMFRSNNLLTVYPRVGGGNSGNDILKSRGPGLSPRGRGKLMLEWIDRGAVRSIPAWAGETQRQR